ncbi:PTS sugar transporter subunit IIC [Lacticaseibacillus jixianensis]|uniref:Permease IIC component n=1 Tax=Lacticaseibacillus jixianensis TaxID=2486012 RepID=A0ABW4B894_9LACO|nr:PTS transporter subunit EIIC [Lacticaseibacillus jixianensis]
MQRITGFIEKRIAPPLIKFSNLKYVQVIQRNGLGIMSLLVIGSLFTLVASFPIPAWLTFLGDFRWTIAAAAGVGTSFIALYTVCTTSYALVEWYNKNRGEKTDIMPPMILAIASYLLLNPIQTVSTVVKGSKTPGVFTGVSTVYMGAMGVFAGIIVGIVTVEIYRFFVNRHLTIKLPSNVPPMVSSAFVALIPSFVVVVFWWLIGSVLKINIPDAIANIFKPLISVSDTPWAMMIATLLNRGLWSVGIHGGNIVGGVLGTFWTQMVAANQAAFAKGISLPYTFTSIFQDVYIMTGMVPLSVALLLTKSKRYRGMGALGIVPAAFNIGEPLIFGLPIMLNPLMMIPFVLSSVVMDIAATLLVMLKWLPVPALSVPWITPAPIKAYLATGGNIWAVVFVLVGWVVTFLIYYPFVASMDKAERTGALKVDSIEGEDDAGAQA